MQDLIDAMAKIADPVIKAYHDDFRVHDRKVIEGLKSGDVILWTPRACGSHLIVLARGYVPNTLAAQHFAAISERLDWYSVAMGPTDWTLKPEPDAASVVAAYAERLRTTREYAEPVSELHL